jgi:ankyrin repeat protein
MFLTPLHIAVMEQNVQIAKSLLSDYKAEVDCTDYRNNTPLHYALINGNIKLVKVLLTHFPRIDIENLDN